MTDQPIRQYPDERREMAETDMLGIVPAEHVYLSTGCLHGRHDYCSNVDGIAGSKTPAQCKFCTAPCQCPCHQPEEPSCTNASPPPPSPKPSPTDTTPTA